MRIEIDRQATIDTSTWPSRAEWAKRLREAERLGDAKYRRVLHQAFVAFHAQALLEMGRPPTKADRNRWREDMGSPARRWMRELQDAIGIRYPNGRPKDKQ